MLLKSLYRFLVFLAFIKNCKLGTPKYVFPPTSPTRHQFISGIGVPLNLQNEAITYGWTMKAQYYLPETINQLHFQFFPDIWVANYTKDFLFDTVWQRFPNGRRRREIAKDSLTGQIYEKYEGVFAEISNMPLDSAVESLDDFDDQFEEDILDKKISLLSKNHVQTEADEIGSEADLVSSSTRWFIYDVFAATLEKHGFNGRMCLLRAICEATRVQFTKSNLMGELFHIFFTPSTTSEPVDRPYHYDYIQAEIIGHEKSDDDICGKKFFQCKTSVLDIFTQDVDEFFSHFI